MVRDAQMVLLGRDGGTATIESNREAKLLALGGELVDEPVVARGSFVLHTTEQIR